MNIRKLIIEVTRRCQLTCIHCLRGDAESTNILYSYIDEMLEGVTTIGEISFSGGEPLLNIKAIAYFLEICKRDRIEVENFYIATNGLITAEKNDKSIECLKTIIELWAYCTDNEISGVGVSVDKFHITNIEKRNLLYALIFTHKKGPDLEEKWLVPEGRGGGFCTQRRPEKNEPSYEHPGDNIVYLSVHGGIVWNCDLSFERVDEEAVSIKEAKVIIEKLAKIERKE